jgi:hypothetical protein
MPCSPIIALRFGGRYAFIIRVEEHAIKMTSKNLVRGQLSKILLNIYPTTRRHIRENVVPLSWCLYELEFNRICFPRSIVRFGHKTDEVAGGWRKLYNEISVVNSSGIGRAGNVARIERNRNLYGILVGKSEGDILIGWPGHRWEDSIKIDLKAIGWLGIDWINLAENSNR